MPKFTAIPFGTEEYQLPKDSVSTLQFSVTLDGVAATNISSATFALKHTLVSTDYVFTGSCTVSGSTCTIELPASLGELDPILGELQITLTNGQVHTVYQGVLHIV